MPERLGYVNEEYLKVAAQFLRPFKPRTYERMQIRPGASLLDVGCGAGADTMPLAGLAGATGRVVGVDHDHGMPARAKSTAEAAGMRRHFLLFGEYGVGGGRKAAG